MSKYASPAIVSCGKSNEVIKGQCGFGAENWTLDKTGMYKSYGKVWVRVAIIAGREVFECRDDYACVLDNC